MSQYDYYGDLLDDPLMSVAEFNRWVNENYADKRDYMDYDSYKKYYGKYTTFEEPDDNGGDKPDGGGGFEYVGPSMYIDAASDYWENFPFKDALTEYGNWFLPYSKELQLRDLPDYDTQIATPEGENYLTALMRQRIEQGRSTTRPQTGLAAAYEGAYESYVPQFKESYDEEVMKPAQERLAALGIEGTPAIESMAALGRKGALQEASLRKDVDVAKAGAMRQEWADLSNWELQSMGLTDQDIQSYRSLYTSGEERERRNTESAYSHFLRQEKQPYETAGNLGVPVFNTTMGTASNVYNAGGQYATQLGTQAMSSSATLGAAQLNNEWANYMANQEMNFMEPFLQQSSQPVDVSGGGGYC